MSESRRFVHYMNFMPILNNLILMADHFCWFNCNIPGMTQGNWFGKRNFNGMGFFDMLCYFAYF